MFIGLKYVYLQIWFHFQLILLKLSCLFESLVVLKNSTDIQCRNHDDASVTTENFQLTWDSFSICHSIDQHEFCSTLIMGNLQGVNGAVQQYYTLFKCGSCGFIDCKSVALNVMLRCPRCSTWMDRWVSVAVD